MLRLFPLRFCRSKLSRIAAFLVRKKRFAFHVALSRLSRDCKISRNPHASHRALFESLEPRHLMAAVPFAHEDAAFYTDTNTDLVVTTSSIPAHLLANDLDIDGGSITSSTVSNPTSGTLIALGTDGTFTYRPNTGFSGIDSFTYKINDGSLDSNVTKADGSSLATGMYDYTLTVATTIGGATINQTFTGKQAIVNRSASEFGSDFLTKRKISFVSRWPTKWADFINLDKSQQVCSFMFHLCQLKLM